MSSVGLSKTVINDKHTALLTSSCLCLPKWIQLMYEFGCTAITQLNSYSILKDFWVFGFAQGVSPWPPTAVYLKWHWNQGTLERNWMTQDCLISSGTAWPVTLYPRTARVHTLDVWLKSLNSTLHSGLISASEGHNTDCVGDTAIWVASIH